MQHTEQISERLAAISAELAHIAKLLANPQVKANFPREARDRFIAGVCLHPECKRKRSDIQFRRGNCPTHYAKLKKVIDKRGAVAEFQFIENGLLAPDDYNPNPTEFDAVVQGIDEQESRLLAAAESAAVKPIQKKRGRAKSN